MAAEYGRPKLIDTLSYRASHGVLRARCRCDHFAQMRLLELMIRHTLPGQLQLYQLIERLYCSRCGARPSGAEVV